MTTWLSLLAAATAAPTPLPVHVENWPAVPGPDKVALEMLWLARCTFWATIGFGGAAVIAYIDFIRRLRKPKLSISLCGRSRDARPLAWPPTGNGIACGFGLALQINNDGKRAVSGCYVSVWVQKSLDWRSLEGPWQFGGEFPDPLIDEQYRRASLYIEKPVFVDHPILLEPIQLVSERGLIEFEVRWQVYDETGKTPNGMPAVFRTGVEPRK
jgi:hypothetical protein